MKKMKIAAAAVVLVMLASAMIIGITATQYDADDAVYDYKVYLDVGDTATPTTVILQSNIDYYYKLAKSINGTVKIEWKAGTTTADTKFSTDTVIPTTGTNTVQISGSIKDTGDTTESSKNLAVALEKNAGTPPNTILIKVTIIVEVNKTSVTTQTLNYKLTIISGTGGTSYNFNSITFVRDVYHSAELSTTDNTFSRILFNYYAEHLPDGLSMTPDGIISGIVKTKDKDLYPTVIYMENKTTGEISHGDLNINVVTFGYTVYKGTGEDRTLFTQTTGDNYYIDKGTKFTISIDGAIPGTYKVSVVDLTSGNSYKEIPFEDVINNNEVTSKDAKNISFTNGTGTYKVNIIRTDNYSGTVATFNLYVIGNVVGVGSDILVGSR